MKRTLTIALLLIAALGASAQQPAPPKPAEKTVEQLKRELADAHLTIARLREQILQSQNALADAQKQALGCFASQVEADKAAAEEEVKSLQPKKDDKKPSPTPPQK
jgi:predicted ATP-grasp superfamily ATP-dependent carboligase